MVQLDHLMEENLKRGYFAPYDADFIDGETDWTSVFQLDEFIPFVTNRITARQLLFLFDCCFSGLIIQPPEYESQREFKCATDMINAAKNNRSVQIYTAASKDEEILASSGISPPISVFTESIERIIKNVNPLNYPEGFLSAHKLSKDVTMLVRETSILLRVPQNPVYYFSTLDDRGEFVFKQFTEDEINSAKDTRKIKFEPLEEFIGKSDLSEVFNEQNLVGLKRVVEQNHGLDYTFQQLQSTIHDLVRQHGSIVNAVNALNLDGTSFSIEQIFNYVANSLVGLGLATDVFKPQFVHKSNMNQEETS